jgi:hypothetical protein
VSSYASLEAAAARKAAADAARKTKNATKVPSEDSYLLKAQPCIAGNRASAVPGGGTTAEAEVSSWDDSQETEVASRDDGSAIRTGAQSFGASNSSKTRCRVTAKAGRVGGDLPVERERVLDISSAASASAREDQQDADASSAADSSDSEVAAADREDGESASLKNGTPFVPWG